jgi:hypothetical protein
VRERKIFPEIIINKRARGLEALVGLKLTSILKADLISPDWSSKNRSGESENPLNAKSRQTVKEQFLQSVSTWPADVVLELHLTALPDLLKRSRGKLLVTLFLRSYGRHEDQVREQVVIRYLSLLPLLQAHFPEAVFAPVQNRQELLSLHRPFAVGHAAALKRRVQIISLAAPLSQRTLGFGPLRVNRDESPFQIHHCFPWIPSQNDGTRLLRTLMGQLDPVQIIVRIKNSRLPAGTLRRLEDAILITEDFIAGHQDRKKALYRQASILRDLSLFQLADLNTCSFKIGVFMLAPGKIDDALGNVLGAAITGPSQGADENTVFKGRFVQVDLPSEKVLNGRYFPETEPYSLTEAACAFCLPWAAAEEGLGLPVRRFRTAAVLSPESGPIGQETIRVFANVHQGTKQDVVFGSEDRMRHMFIMGQTGTGKSTLMENMILQDIRSGKGLAVIDPHGEIIDAIIGKIPPDRAEDVVLLDMLDRQRPLGFNLLAWKSLEERDLIIDELYQTVDRIYDMRHTGGPIFENNFRNMLKLLMGAEPRQGFVPTILEFTRCYLDGDFRKWLRESISDLELKDFVDELERTGGEGSLSNLAPYVTSKLGRFTNDITLKRIVGQQKTRFDFAEIMNRGKILLVKLGKGRFGPTVSALLANQIVSRFKLAAMQRAEINYEKRRDFFLYVDECHNLPAENFMELLAEARKYRMGLVLATQYAAQLTQNVVSTNNNLLAAVFGNVGTIAVFRLGHEDAAQIDPVLHPCFSALDIIGLPNWHGYARVQLNNEVLLPFSFETLKDACAFDPASAARIRQMSSRKYGVDVKEVDQQILRRRSVWKQSQD